MWTREMLEQGRAGQQLHTDHTDDRRGLKWTNQGPAHTAGGNVGTRQCLVQPASLQASGASPISRYRKVMIGLLFIAFNSRFVLASFFSEEIFELSSLAF